MLLRVAASTALLSTVVGAAAVTAEPISRIEIGVLNCKVEGGAGFIVASSKRLECVLERPIGPERYYGHITKFGVDIGGTFEGMLSWAVLAPASSMPDGSLEGSYAGLTGEATVGYGVSANALLGGSGRSIALQPVSVGAQKGFNLAAGIASMELTARKE